MFHRIVVLRTVFIVALALLAGPRAARADSWMGAGKATAAAFDMSEEAQAFADSIEFVASYNALAYLAEDIAKKSNEIIDKAASPSGYGQAQWKFVELKEVFHDLEDGWNDVHGANQNGALESDWDALVNVFLKLNYVMEAGKIATAANTLAARAGELNSACGTNPALTSVAAKAQQLAQHATTLQSNINAASAYGVATAQFAKVKAAQQGTANAMAGGGTGALTGAYKNVEAAYNAVHVALFDQAP